MDVTHRNECIFHFTVPKLQTVCVELGLN